MGLINSVTMQYFNTVIKNLKSTLISKIDGALEVHIGASEPASESYKIWIDNETVDDNVDAQIPFVNDTTVSYEDTWSSQKISEEVNKATEIYVGTSKPSDSQYKIWINSDGSNGAENVPFVDDNTASTYSTYSSTKIEEIKTAIENNVNYLMELTNTLSTI